MPHGTAAADGETLSASAILCDDVDATAEVNAMVYRTGHFNSGALTVATGYTMKTADEEELRKCGIFLGAAMD